MAQADGFTSKRWLKGAAAVACLLMTAGCERRPIVPVRQQAAGDLDRRALDLLMRAAQSDIDVVRANAIEALWHVAPDSGLPLIREGVAAESPMVRFAALACLGELKDRGSAGAARRAMADPDQRVRLAAAFAAARLGDKQAPAELVNALNGSPDENLRSDAAYLIGRIGEKKAVQRLKIAAGRERSNKALAHILAAMATLGDRDGMDALIQYSKSDLVSRLVALQTLADLKQTRAVDALRAALKDERAYVQMRLIAARGLGRLGLRDGYSLAAGSIKAVTEDESETMRLRSLAAMALGAIGDRAALPLLQSVAEDRSDPRTQVAASYAICELLGVHR